MNIERADFEIELLSKGIQDQLHVAREMGQEEEFLDQIEKSMGHKYFKREPNKSGKGYRYYYTEAEYKAEKGGDSTDSSSISISSSYGDSVFSSKETAINPGGKLTKPENYSVLVMNDGKFLRTTNNRASQFAKQGSGKIIGKFDPNQTFQPISNSSTKFKDATDHIIKEGDTYTIDILDPDTEHKKFKKGDKIKFEGKTGVVGKNLGDDIHEVILDK